MFRWFDYFGEAWTANQAFLNGSIMRGQQFFMSSPMVPSLPCKQTEC